MVAHEHDRDCRRVFSTRPRVAQRRSERCVVEVLMCAVRALLESVEFRALFYRAELAHLVKILIPLRAPVPRGPRASMSHDAPVIFLTQNGAIVLCRTLPGGESSLLGPILGRGRNRG